MRRRILLALPMCALSLSLVANTAHGDDAKGIPAPAAAPVKAAPKKTKKTKTIEGLVAMHPGFSQKEDGTSRVYVDLSATANVEEKKGAKQITYVIKGARVTVRNNTRALDTAHFNTPVSRARLVQKGSDVWLIVDLRADVAAAWKLDAAASGNGARLNIDFPSGQFAQAADTEPTTDAGASKAADE